MELNKVSSEEEHEKRVSEFMKKKEQQLKQSCQIDKKPEGITALFAYRNRYAPYA